MNPKLKQNLVQLEAIAKELIAEEDEQSRLVGLSLRILVNATHTGLHKEYCQGVIEIEKIIKLQ